MSDKLTIRKCSVEERIICPIYIDTLITLTDLQGTMHEDIIRTLCKNIHDIPGMCPQLVELNTKIDENEKLVFSHIEGIDYELKVGSLPSEVQPYIQEVMINEQHEKAEEYVKIDSIIDDISNKLQSSGLSQEQLNSYTSKIRQDITNNRPMEFVFIKARKCEVCNHGFVMENQCSVCKTEDSESSL